MSTLTNSTTLQQEWSTLHSDHERYDQYALIIKLVAIITAVISLSLALPLLITVLFTAIIWLQEGIWRTVQGRCFERLLVVENLLKEHPNTQGMQFYSEWEYSRPGAVGTIIEYLRNAIRPTVAYPYAILIAVELAFILWMQ